MISFKGALDHPRVDSLAGYTLAFDALPDHVGGTRLNEAASLRVSACKKGKKCKSSKGRLAPSDILRGGACVADLQGGVNDHPVTIDSMYLGPRYLGAHTSIQTAPQAMHFLNTKMADTLDRRINRVRYVHLRGGLMATRADDTPCSGPGLDTGIVAHYATRDGIRPASMPLVSALRPSDSSLSAPGSQGGECARGRGVVRGSGPTFLRQVGQRAGRHLSLY